MVSAEMVLPQQDELQESWAEGRLVLPGGVLDAAGNCCKTIFVRQLTGADEELLADRTYRSGAQQASDFLARVIVRIEGVNQPVTSAMTGNMLVGDRDYLLLRLRQINVGNRVEEVVRCVRTECGKKADIEFSIDELAVRRVDKVLGRYEITVPEPAIPGDPESVHCAFRLPAGHDQESLAELGETNVAASNTRLFSRVLLRVGNRSKVDETTVRGFPMNVRRHLSRALASHSPGPDLEVEAQCPHCGADMSYPFDLYGFFLPSR